MSDAKDFEYRIKGTEEAMWRAIGWKDAKSLRDAADYMYDTLYELAGKIEQEQ